MNPFLCIPELRVLSLTTLLSVMVINAFQHPTIAFLSRLGIRSEINIIHFYSFLKRLGKQITGQYGW
jgi:hypothetical protein